MGALVLLKLYQNLMSLTIFNLAKLHYAEIFGKSQSHDFQHSIRLLYFGVA